MFCPRCATQNIEGASFCRSCGADISLISDALSGTLAQAPPPEDRLDLHSRRRRRREREREKPIEASTEKGILNIFVGLGFIFAALAVMYRFPAGMFWGWCFFIPGFQALGRGVASIVAARNASAKSNQLPAGGSGAYLPNSQAGSATAIPPVAQTGQLMNPVPSVTEGTTRHLGAEAPTRHFDPVTGKEQLP